LVKTEPGQQRFGNPDQNVLKPCRREAPSFIWEAEIGEAKRKSQDRATRSKELDAIEHVPMGYLLDLIRTLSWPIVALVAVFGLGRILWMLIRQSIRISGISPEIGFLRSDLADIRQIIREEKRKVADAIEAKQFP
jgi:hypothetical protein